MSLNHNPQMSANTYISMTRNMYVTSSIGLTVIIFSKNFNKYEKMLQILSSIILIYSIFYGYQASVFFNQYIDFLKKQKKLSEPYISQLQYWKQLTTFTYIYIIIVLIILFIIIFRKILK